MAKQSGKAIRAASGGNLIGPWLAQALADGKAVLGTSATRQTITYVGVGHTESFDDPEEWVRADFWAELIYRLKYPEQRIAIEVPVPDRVPGDYADLVVCQDDARTRPFIVVECKADGIGQSEFEQAVEQAVGNGSGHKFRAEYVAVVAGRSRRVLDVSDRFGILERVKNEVADLPADYKDPAAYRLRKSATPGDPSDLRPATKEELITILEKCHDALWEGGRLSPPQAFSELCKFLFVKIADEKKARKVGEPYEVQIKTGETADALAARIHTIYQAHRRSDPDIFTEDLRVGPQKIRVLVEHIQSTSFGGSDLDAKGIAFERFMDSFFKGGFGQYFTPREVVSFAVAMTDVEPDEWVVDPACGSGGFLLHALEDVRRKVDGYATPGSAEHYQMWNDFATKRLFGIEISEEIARICKMNMILHGDGHTNIVAHDALVRPAVLLSLNQGLRMGSFDVLLTNVPFGAGLTLDEHPYLAEFRYLGNTEVVTKTKGTVRKPRKSQKSEIIFLERIEQLLRPGGRAAIIVPDGILTNASTGYVRDFLLGHFQINAVVSLPVEAFTHYGANVKASVMFLRKLDKGESPNPDAPVFLAEAASVGYDATGRAAPNQLPDILAAYREFCRDPRRNLVEVPDLGSPASEDEGDE